MSDSKRLKRRNALNKCTLMKMNCRAARQSPEWFARWSLTGVLAGTSITEMCILLIWAFRLPSFLKAQLQSMHGNRGAPFDCVTETEKKKWIRISSICILSWQRSNSAGQHSGATAYGEVCKNRLELLEESVRCDVHWEEEKKSAQDSCESTDAVSFTDNKEKNWSQSRR